MLDSEIGLLKGMATLSGSLGKPHARACGSAVAEIAELRAIVGLAKMLIQPGKNGPQLEGNKHFREALLRAVREMKWSHPLEAEVKRLQEELTHLREKNT